MTVTHDQLLRSLVSSMTELENCRLREDKAREAVIRQQDIVLRIQARIERQHMLDAADHFIARGISPGG